MENRINLLELIEEWDSARRFSEQAFYDYYQEARRYQNLYEKVKTLHDCKWCKDRPFDGGLVATIEKWLGNFRSKGERKTAFELLLRIIFYSESEMKVLCDTAVKKLQEIIERISGTRANVSFLNEHSIFVPLTDSGAVWCRRIRHEKGLASGAFRQSPGELKNSDFQQGHHVIFVEDFAGSGSDTVTRYGQFRLGERKNFAKGIHLHYLCLIATADAINTIQEHTEFEIVTGEVLGNEYKCFSDHSILYPEWREKQQARRVFVKYGSKLCREDPEIKDFPLGFADCELTVVLYDNTPDNSLPVIWYPDKGWFPVFERSKRYHGELC